MSGELPVCCVSGCSTGIGFAIVKNLLRSEHRVVALSRRIENLEKLRKEGNEKLLHVVKLDVRKAETSRSLVDTLPDYFKQISVLVNNAGMAKGLKKLQTMEESDWEEMIDTNIKGVLNLTAAVLPGMVARNEGIVVNIGSVAASYAYPGGNVYGATKAFVHHLSEHLRADLFGTNVRVSVIAPGLVETDFSKVRFDGDVDKAAAVYKDKRALQAQDIADAVSYVISAPPHVNVSLMQILPTTQAPGGLKII